MLLTLVGHHRCGGDSGYDVFKRRKGKRMPLIGAIAFHDITKHDWPVECVEWGGVNAQTQGRGGGGRRGGEGKQSRSLLICAS